MTRTGLQTTSLPAGVARARYVRAMFDAIAGRYDLMNRLMSLGRDAVWRQRTAAAAVVPRARLALDVGAGTGDLSLALAEAMASGGQVVALDFAPEMLRALRVKLQRTPPANGVAILPVLGDALALPFRLATFDVLATAFTIRNVADLDQTLAEFRRVMHPGGRMASLEITSPTLPIFRTLFQLYFEQFVPLVGALVTGHGSAYRYLPASVTAFLSRDQLRRRFQVAGFSDVTAQPLALGTVAIHAGTRPAVPREEADLVGEAVPASAWDQLLQRLPGAHLLQSAAWIRARETLGWTAHRLTFRRDDRLVAAAAVLRRPLPVPGLGIAYVPKGPTLAAWDGTTIRAVCRALAGWAREQRVLWLKIDPDVSADDAAVAAAFRAAGFHPADEQVQLPATVLLDLRGSENDLLRRMHRKWRYNVRLAQRRGVRVRWGAARDLDEFYRLYQETADRDQFVIRPLAYYQTVWQHLHPGDQIALLLAEVQDETVAGLIVTRYGRRAWYLYGASAARHRNYQPNHLLQWRAMQWARAHGCDTYDLWGAPSELREDDPMWGVYRFKLGFGGRYVRWLGAYDYIPSPLLYRAWQVALGAYRRVTQAASPPGPLSNQLERGSPSVGETGVGP